MKKITSTQNPEIKNVAQLTDAATRYEQTKFCAEGLRTCTTLMQSGMKLMQLYVTEKTLSDISTLCSEKKITIVNEAIIKKISATKTPSGIVGVFQLPDKPKPETLTTGIVLANLSDPGNMGTLIRTCAALGKKSVVIIDGVDPWHPKVVQASAGTIGLVTIFQLTWQELLQHKKNLKLYALVVSGGKQISAVDAQHGLLVVGNEAHGIPKEWENRCDESITLAMPGGTESLNAAVAGSIAMYLIWESKKLLF